MGKNLWLLMSMALLFLEGCVASEIIEPLPQAHAQPAVAEKPTPASGAAAVPAKIVVE